MNIVTDTPDTDMAQALREMIDIMDGQLGADVVDDLCPKARIAVAAHESRAQAATGKTLALFTANQAQMLLDAFGGSATTYALREYAEGECAPQDNGTPSPPHHSRKRRETENESRFSVRD